MKTIIVNANPNILKWARNEAGYSSHELAEKLKVDIDVVRNWENTGKNIRYSMLKKIADFYKRQPLIFLLSDENFHGETTKPPTDFRSLSAGVNTFSPGLKLAIRRTKRYLKIYRQLVSFDLLTKQYNWLNNLSQEKLITPNMLRKLIHLDIYNQKKKKNQKFSSYRALVETHLNIFVFQFRMEQGECDGFAYTEDGIPYAIVVNSSNTDTQKTFTLFHEIGHILNSTDGLCVIDSTAKGEEAKCNAFASEFLSCGEQKTTFPSFI
jgi:transcriptional regulator with XRE-family HTH domain